MQRERLKKRYEEMKRDSQRLLELATELKQYVDKSGENVLSLEVLRKAEEMERLARQVKNNMRAEIGELRLGHEFGPATCARSLNLKLPAWYIFCLPENS